jgi:hypothetical protein
MPNSAAAAADEIEGPCHRPSRQNARAGSMPCLSVLGGRLVKRTSKLARIERSPTWSSSSLRYSSLSRLAMALMVQPARVTSRAAQIRMASGRPAQASSSSEVASGSAAARSSPTTLTNSFSASSSPSTLRSTSLVLARSGILLRVVTSTADDAVPGSSGLTWAASRALSSTTSIRSPASAVRYLIEYNQGKHDADHGPEWRCLGDSPAIGVVLNPGCGWHSERPAPQFRSTEATTSPPLTGRSASTTRSTPGSSSLICSPSCAPTPNAMRVISCLTGRKRQASSVTAVRPWPARRAISSRGTPPGTSGDEGVAQSLLGCVTEQCGA